MSKTRRSSRGDNALKPDESEATTVEKKSAIVVSDLKRTARRKRRHSSSSSSSRRRLSETDDAEDHRGKKRRKRHRTVSSPNDTKNRRKRNGNMKQQTVQKKDESIAVRRRGGGGGGGEDVTRRSRTDTTIDERDPADDKLETFRDGRGILYVKEETIGVGTFSIVVKGRVERDDRASRNGGNAARSREKVDAGENEEGRVAFKIVHKNSDPKRILNELKRLRDLGSREHHVIELLGTYRDKDTFVFVLPYYRHDGFSEIMKRADEALIATYMKQLFTALAHMHKNGVIHRDIKPGNFLFSIKRREGVLIDFGLAEEDRSDTVGPAMKMISARRRQLKRRTPTSFAEAHRAPSKRKCIVHSLHCCKKCNLVNCPGNASRAGTPGFRAPEVLAKSIVQTTAIDVWSAGVIYASLLTGRYPFFPFRSDNDMIALCEILVALRRDSEKRIVEQFKHFHKRVELVHFRKWLARDVDDVTSSSSDSMRSQYGAGLGLSNIVKIVRPNVSTDAMDLLHKCLTISPVERITARGALSHPFLASLDATQEDAT